MRTYTSTREQVLTGGANNVINIDVVSKRAKPGPKGKPRSERMTRIIGIRVTEAEYRRLARLARKEHVPLAAWVRGRLLRAVEGDATVESTQEELETRRREQEEALAEAKLLLRETRTLYQSAAPTLQRAKGKRSKPKKTSEKG